MRPISQWAYVQAKADIVCPHCHAAAGRPCCTPKGFPRAVHAERIVAYKHTIGDAEFIRRKQGLRRAE